MMRTYLPHQKEFAIPFKADLITENSWVLLSSFISWDRYTDIYNRNFKTNCWAHTQDAKRVIVLVIIKHIQKIDLVGVIMMIQKSPYMQCFLRLSAFSKKPVMAPSLLVHTQKRIDLSVY